jgi:hypothetical protein
VLPPRSLSARLLLLLAVGFPVGLVARLAVGLAVGLAMGLAVALRCIMFTENQRSVRNGFDGGERKWRLDLDQRSDYGLYKLEIDRVQPFT